MNLARLGVSQTRQQYPSHRPKSCSARRPQNQCPPTPRHQGYWLPRSGLSTAKLASVCSGEKAYRGRVAGADDRRAISCPRFSKVARRLAEASDARASSERSRSIKVIILARLAAKASEFRIYLGCHGDHLSPPSKLGRYGSPACPIKFVHSPLLGDHCVRLATPPPPSAWCKTKFSAGSPGKTYRSISGLAIKCAKRAATYASVSAAAIQGRSIGLACHHANVGFIALVARARPGQTLQRHLNQLASHPPPGWRSMARRSARLAAVQQKSMMTSYSAALGPRYGSDVSRARGRASIENKRMTGEDLGRVPAKAQNPAGRAKPTPASSLIKRSVARRSAWRQPTLTATSRLLT